MTPFIVLAAALATVAPASPQAPIQVLDAWARATAASGQSGGVFLTVQDTGAPDRLVSASTPVAAMAELHETVNDNGIMRMRPVPALPVAPGKPAVLKPGGYHIMLMGLKQQLKPGEMFPVTLTFEKAGAITATVTVGKAGAMGPGMAKMP